MDMMKMSDPEVGTTVTAIDGRSGKITAVYEGIATIEAEDGTTDEVPISQLLDTAPFLLFPCVEECGQKVILMERLEPGQAAVLECDNCGESWTVLVPSVEVHKTSEFEAIWEFTGQ
jgi:hypothetical protein